MPKKKRRKRKKCVLRFCCAANISDSDEDNQDLENALSNVCSQALGKASKQEQDSTVPLTGTAASGKRNNACKLQKQKYQNISKDPCQPPSKQNKQEEKAKNDPWMKIRASIAKLQGSNGKSEATNVFECQSSGVSQEKDFTQISDTAHHQNSDFESGASMSPSSSLEKICQPVVRGKEDEKKSDDTYLNDPKQASSCEKAPGTQRTSTPESIMPSDIDIPSDMKSGLSDLQCPELTSVSITASDIQVVQPADFQREDRQRSSPQEKTSEAVVKDITNEKKSIEIDVLCKEQRSAAMKVSETEALTPTNLQKERRRRSTSAKKTSEAVVKDITDEKKSGKIDVVCKEQTSAAMKVSETEAVTPTDLQTERRRRSSSTKKTSEAVVKDITDEKKSGKIDVVCKEQTSAAMKVSETEAVSPTDLQTERRQRSTSTKKTSEAIVKDISNEKKSGKIDVLCKEQTSAAMKVSETEALTPTDLQKERRRRSTLTKKTSEAVVKDITDEKKSGKIDVVCKEQTSAAMKVSETEAVTPTDLQTERRRRSSSTKKTSEAVVKDITDEKKSGKIDVLCKEQTSAAMKVSETEALTPTDLQKERRRRSTSAKKTSEAVVKDTTDEKKSGKIDVVCKEQTSAVMKVSETEAVTPTDLQTERRRRSTSTKKTSEAIVKDISNEKKSCKIDVLCKEQTSAAMKVSETEALTPTDLQTERRRRSTSTKKTSEAVVKDITDEKKSGKIDVVCKEQTSAAMKVSETEAATPTDLQTERRRRSSSTKKTSEAVVEDISNEKKSCKIDVVCKEQTSAVMKVSETEAVSPTDLQTERRQRSTSTKKTSEAIVKDISNEKKSGKIDVLCKEQTSAAMKVSETEALTPTDLQKERRRRSTSTKKTSEAVVKDITDEKKSCKIDVVCKEQASAAMKVSETEAVTPSDLQKERRRRSSSTKKTSEAVVKDISNEKKSCKIDVHCKEQTSAAMKVSQTEAVTPSDLQKERRRRSTSTKKIREAVVEDIQNEKKPVESDLQGKKKTSVPKKAECLKYPGKNEAISVKDLIPSYGVRTAAKYKMTSGSQVVKTMIDNSISNQVSEVVKILAIQAARNAVEEQVLPIRKNEYDKKEGTANITLSDLESFVPDDRSSKQDENRNVCATEVRKGQEVQLEVDKKCSKIAREEPIISNTDEEHFTSDLIQKKKSIAVKNNWFSNHLTVKKISNFPPDVGCESRNEITNVVVFQTNSQVECEKSSECCRYDGKMVDLIEKESVRFEKELPISSQTRCWEDADLVQKDKTTFGEESIVSNNKEGKDSDNLVQKLAPFEKEPIIPFPTIEGNFIQKDMTPHEEQLDIPSLITRRDKSDSLQKESQKEDCISRTKQRDDAYLVQKFEEQPTHLIEISERYSPTLPKKDSARSKEVFGNHTEGRHNANPLRKEKGSHKEQPVVLSEISDWDNPSVSEKDSARSKDKSNSHAERRLNANQLKKEKGTSKEQPVVLSEISDWDNPSVSEKDSARSKDKSGSHAERRHNANPLKEEKGTSKEQPVVLTEISDWHNPSVSEKESARSKDKSSSHSERRHNANPLKKEKGSHKEQSVVLTEISDWDNPSVSEKDSARSKDKSGSHAERRHNANPLKKEKGTSKEQPVVLSEINDWDNPSVSEKDSARSKDKSGSHAERRHNANPLKKEKGSHKEQSVVLTEISDWHNPSVSEKDSARSKDKSSSHAERRHNANPLKKEKGSHKEQSVVLTEISDWHNSSVSEKDSARSKDKSGSHTEGRHNANPLKKEKGTSKEQPVVLTEISDWDNPSVSEKDSARSKDKSGSHTEGRHNANPLKKEKGTSKEQPVVLTEISDWDNPSVSEKDSARSKDKSGSHAERRHNANPLKKEKGTSKEQPVVLTEISDWDNPSVSEKDSARSKDKSVSHAERRHNANPLKKEKGTSKEQPVVLSEINDWDNPSVSEKDSARSKDKSGSHTEGRHNANPLKKEKGTSKEQPVVLSEISDWDNPSVSEKDSARSKDKSGSHTEGRHNANPLKKEKGTSKEQPVVLTEISDWHNPSVSEKDSARSKDKSSSHAERRLNANPLKKEKGTFKEQPVVLSEINDWDTPSVSEKDSARSKDKSGSHTEGRHNANPLKKEKGTSKEQPVVLTEISDWHNPSVSEKDSARSKDKSGSHTEGRHNANPLKKEKGSPEEQSIVLSESSGWDTPSLSEKDSTRSKDKSASHTEGRHNANLLKKEKGTSKEQPIDVSESSGWDTPSLSEKDSARSKDKSASHTERRHNGNLMQKEKDSHKEQPLVSSEIRDRDNPTVSEKDSAQSKDKCASQTEGRHTANIMQKEKNSHQEQPTILSESSGWDSPSISEKNSARSKDESGSHTEGRHNANLLKKEKSTVKELPIVSSEIKERDSSSCLGKQSISLELEYSQTKDKDTINLMQKEKGSPEEQPIGVSEISDWDTPSLSEKDSARSKDKSGSHTEGRHNSNLMQKETCTDKEQPIVSSELRGKDSSSNLVSQSEDKDNADLVKKEKSTVEEQSNVKEKNNIEDRCSYTKLHHTADLVQQEIYKEEEPISLNRVKDRKSPDIKDKESISFGKEYISSSQSKAKDTPDLMQKAQDTEEEVPVIRSLVDDRWNPDVSEMSHFSFEEECVSLTCSKERDNADSVQKDKASYVQHSIISKENNEEESVDLVRGSAERFASRMKKLDIAKVRYIDSNSSENESISPRQLPCRRKPSLMDDFVFEEDSTRSSESDSSGYKERDNVEFIQKKETISREESIISKKRVSQMKEKASYVQQSIISKDNKEESVDLVRGSAERFASRMKKMDIAKVRYIDSDSSENESISPRQFPCRRKPSLMDDFVFEEDSTRSSESDSSGSKERDKVEFIQKKETISREESFISKERDKEDSVDFVQRFATIVSQLGGQNSQTKEQYTSNLMQKNSNEQPKILSWITERDQSNTGLNLAKFKDNTPAREYQSTSQHIIRHADIQNKKRSSVKKSVRFSEVHRTWILGDCMSSDVDCGYNFNKVISKRHMLLEPLEHKTAENEKCLILRGDAVQKSACTGKPVIEIQDTAKGDAVGEKVKVETKPSSQEAEDSTSWMDVYSDDTDYDLDSDVFCSDDEKPPTPSPKRRSKSTVTPGSKKQPTSSKVTQQRK